MNNQNLIVNHHATGSYNAKLSAPDSLFSCSCSLFGKQEEPMTAIFTVKNDKLYFQTGTLSIFESPLFSGLAFISLSL